jgi:hypothetical protein
MVADPCGRELHGQPPVFAQPISVSLTPIIQLDGWNTIGDWRSVASSHLIETRPRHRHHAAAQPVTVTSDSLGNVKHFCIVYRRIELLTTALAF